MQFSLAIILVPSRLFSSHVSTCPVGGGAIPRAIVCCSVGQQLKHLLALLFTTSTHYSSIHNFPAQGIKKKRKFPSIFSCFLIDVHVYNLIPSLSPPSYPILAQVMLVQSSFGEKLTYNIIYLFFLQILIVVKKLQKTGTEHMDVKFKNKES